VVALLGRGTRQQRADKAADAGDAAETPMSRPPVAERSGVNSVVMRTGGSFGQGMGQTGWPDVGVGPAESPGCYAFIRLRIYYLLLN
jgi:hypothetical protein